MTDADETVADVLRAVDSPDTWKLEEYADPVPGPQPDMEYEDWVRPMKLTGGRVCLRVEPNQGPGFLVEWQPEGLTTWLGDGSEPKQGPDQAAWLKDIIEDTDWNITPVLREDTPFGEGEE